MKKAIGTLVLAGLPALAHAQTQTQVPAIIQGTTAAAVSVAGFPVSGDESAPAKAAGASTAGVTRVAAGPVPAPMPPPVQLLSPSAPLDAKERRAVLLARR